MIAIFVTSVEFYIKIRQKITDCKFNKNPETTKAMCIFHEFFSKNNFLIAVKDMNRDIF